MEQAPTSDQLIIPNKRCVIPIIYVSLQPKYLDLVLVCEDPGASASPLEAPEGFLCLHARQPPLLLQFRSSGDMKLLLGLVCSVHLQITKIHTSRSLTWLSKVMPPSHRLPGVTQWPPPASQHRDFSATFQAPDAGVGGQQKEKGHADDDPILC
ncbi:hypothetical protein AV530_018744 [Patagioenas fasciata monilis]|uniref:Uncharacterized protein n=1 Tax=Patagioenas fasciata monilis TaxID=372326 RepID=A0A1V4JJC7_PATFA|nr:hypothetical protein AV530_018744 [Patagioenas fasciata monilis]